MISREIMQDLLFDKIKQELINDIYLNDNIELTSRKGNICNIEFFFDSSDFDLSGDIFLLREKNNKKEGFLFIRNNYKSENKYIHKQFVFASPKYRGIEKLIEEFFAIKLTTEKENKISDSKKFDLEDLIYIFKIRNIKNRNLTLKDRGLFLYYLFAYNLGNINSEQMFLIEEDKEILRDILENEFNHISYIELLNSILKKDKNLEKIIKYNFNIRTLLE